MTKKELKKLSRADLLELLLLQTRESERLQAELDEARAKLDDRTLRVTKAGNLAKATLEINGVMEAAQEAAAQYLENVRRIEEETRRKSGLLLEELQSKIEAAEQREAEARKLIEQHKQG